MSCEEYRKSIIEAAASGEQPSNPLRLHLDGCTTCRAAFEGERRLFAAIDTGVRKSVHYEVPASLQAVVRARIAEEAMPRWNWMRTWAAVAASAALIIGILVARNARHSDAIPNTKPTDVANVVRQQTPIPGSTSLSPRVAAVRTRKRRGGGFTKSENYVVAGEAQPLVPAGQRQAVDELIAGLQRGEVQGEILVSRTWNGQVEDLQIPAIEIRPLSTVSADEAPPE